MENKKINTAQQLYVRKQKTQKCLVILFRVLSLVLFVCLWEWASRNEVIDSFIFSSPSEIADCFLRMAKDHSIFQHVGVTLGETLLSFGLSIVIGLLAAVLVGNTAALNIFLYGSSVQACLSANFISVLVCLACSVVWAIIYNVLGSVILYRRDVY